MVWNESNESLSNPSSFNNLLLLTLVTCQRPYPTKLTGTEPVSNNVLLSCMTGAMVVDIDLLKTVLTKSKLLLSREAPHPETNSVEQAGPAHWPLQNLNCSIYMHVPPACMDNPPACYSRFIHKTKHQLCRRDQNPFGNTAYWQIYS